MLESGFINFIHGMVIGTMTDYIPSEPFNASIENLRREYFNAPTPYDQWKVFEKAINWIETKNELIYYMNENSKQLREQNG